MKHLILILAIFFSFMAHALPRPEYPRPQFEREQWINLNGEWTCVLDPVKTGWEHGYQSGKPFDMKITVPFAPESSLSGIQHKDFIPCIWYQRQICIPETWSGKNIMLNFGAVYYESEIWIDGKFVGRHFGGSDSFSMNITNHVVPGQTHSLVVAASSDVRSRMQPAGKQALRSKRFSCNYTRTTGIWQTVWMEAVAPSYIASSKVLTDIDASAVSFTFSLGGVRKPCTLKVEMTDNGKSVASGMTRISDRANITLPIRKMKLWSPESPFLYDVTYTLCDNEGNIIDSVSSYIGMRKVHIEGNKVYLNNVPFYQRLVLDQGFYPDGIWTAPSDDALKNDIVLAMKAGFNGARLHQKVFEERFHYWADKLGYMTWGEMPSWGMDANSPEAARNFMAEWTNVINRDINHPSIITWTPLNEEWWPDEVQYPRFVEDLYILTKSLDNTRPVNTVSGGVSIKGCTDIFAVHNYAHDPDKLWDKMYDGGRMYHRRPKAIITGETGNVGFNSPIVNFEYPAELYEYDGISPFILDEFGGLSCRETTPQKTDAFQYGDAPQTKEEFYARLEALIRMLTEKSDYIWGFCYTQLTDVEQEENGIYYYDRTEKFDMERIRSIFRMPLEK